MPAKLTILFLMLLTGLPATAQSYDSDWNAMNRRLEKGEAVPAAEINVFLKKYAGQHEAHADNTTQLYSLLGNSYSTQGMYAEAAEAYGLSLHHARRAADTTLKYIVQLSLAILHQNNNNYLEAEKYYLQCMAGMASIYGQSSREYTELFYYYTSLLVGLGKYNDADPYIDALLYYYKTLDGEDAQRYLTLRYYKGITLQHLGDYNGAIRLFSEAVTSQRFLRLGDTLSWITAFSNLGDVYREAGRYAEGAAQLETAAQMYDKYRLRDPHFRATVLNNLGLCYRGLDDPQKADQAFRSALSIYRAINETATEPYCTTLSNQASLYTDLGRYGEASELLWEAIGIRRKYFGENSVNYANALANLANAYFGAGYYDKALEKNLEANRVYMATVGESHQAYANNLNSLSLCYQYLKNYDKAEDYKLQALAITARTVGKGHYRYISFLISSCELYKQILKDKKAEANLLEALDLAGSRLGKRHELYARAQLALAELYTARRDYAAAAPLYVGCTDYYSAQVSEFFNAMSEGDQLSFIQTIAPVFESYNLFLVNYHLDHPAVDLSDHSRRAFLCQAQLKGLQAGRSAGFRRMVNSSSDTSLVNSYRQWLDLKNLLMNRYKETGEGGDNHDILGHLSQLEVSLKARLPGFSEQSPVSYDQIRQQLKDDEASVAMFKAGALAGAGALRSAYGALAVTRRAAAPRLIVFTQVSELDSLWYQQYYGAIDAQQTDTLSYGRYLQPIASALKGVKRVYLCADGVFHKISYAGLYDPRSQRYAFEAMEIVQIPNPGRFTQKQAQDNRQKTAALFGYPDYEYDFSAKKTLPGAKEPELVASRFGLGQLSRLPGTRQEVEAIAGALSASGWHASVFTEQEASEQVLRDVQGPSVLHIATHGFYLSDIQTEDKRFLGFDRAAIRRDPMLRSGLIMAGAVPATQDSARHDARNDGIFTAAEASGLNLDNTDLVVLSACQTGLGDDMSTEGVAGLQRSFIIAGARNIIMSLWPVDDNATQLLMTSFYRHYAVTEDVASAFSAARLEVKKHYSHPYFWAAFVRLKSFD